MNVIFVKKKNYWILAIYPSLKYLKVSAELVKF